MRRWVLWVMVAGIGVAVGAAQAQQQTSTAVTGGQAAAGPVVKDAAMEQWAKNASPGENHKVLEPFIGNWTHTVRWWKSPEAKPEESQGANTNSWILGGRFLKDESKGQSMGQPFEGVGIIGFDNVKGQYTAVWLDNMSTGIMTASGTYDASTKTIREAGSFSCPVTGNANMAFRADWKLVDNDNYTYETYMAGPDGKEFKALEVIYKRQK